MALESRSTIGFSPKAFVKSAGKFVFLVLKEVMAPDVPTLSSDVYFIPNSHILSDELLKNSTIELGGFGMEV